MTKVYTVCVKQLFFVLCILLSIQLSAQTPIQIGSGTSVPAATLYSPINRVSNSSTNDFSRSNIVYTASELATAGITNGSTISKLAFNKRNAGATVSTTSNIVFEIWMKNSSTVPPLATTTTWTNITSGHTQVYVNNSQSIPSATGWVEFILTNPFVYTGGSLEIATHWDISAVSGNPTTDFFQWEYTSGFETSIIGQIGTSAPATLNGSASAYKFRPNIQITLAAPCTTPPTSGDAIVTNVPGCAGTARTLNLSNNSTGVGQTYVWQSSSTLNGTYTDVSTASSSSAYTASPTVTTFYRAAVTCGGNTRYSNPVEVVVYQPLNGPYTINASQAVSSTNFQSFAQAIAALNCAGVSGPVTFNVTNATYNEQVIFSAVTGASSANKITFNGNGSTIAFSASVTGQRATVKFDGADYIKLDNFTINASAGTYGYGVQLLNDADNNTISNCTINSTVSSTSSQFAGVVINTLASDAAETAGDSKCDGNLITGNTINGGYVGVALTANGNTAQINNNQVINNHITNFYTHGIYVNGNNGAIIKGNDIERPTRSSSITVFYGIYFDDPSKNCIVSENKIHASFDGLTTSTSSQVAINFVNADAVSGSENKVYNNIIYRINGSGIAYGIQNNSSDYSKFYHNTIALENETPNTGSSPTRGFYLTAAATGVEFVNNIIKISREPFGGATGNRIGIDVVTGTDLISNKNDIIVTSSTLAYFGSYGSVLKNDLASWKSSTGLDVASKSVDPQFINSANGDLKPQENILNDIGAPLGITTDILGITRSVTSPDPGAYEFNAGPCSTTIIPGNAIVTTSATPMCAGYPATLDLENNSLGSGQTYKWQSSTTQNGTYTDISSPSAGTSLVINPTTSLWYKAVLTCGVSTQSSTPVQVTVNPELAGGTYTINLGQATGGTNFQTFNDAVYAISCGISSSIVFNVSPGTYNEQVIIPSIPGLSSSKTITFNGNGAILEYASSNTAERATLKLNGTDYVTINNLEIGANGSGTTEYGYAVQLMNDADNNTISNCIIRATTNPATAASSNFAGIVLSGSATSPTAASGCDNNKITGNTITGGYYGITVIGSSANYVQNDTVSNNIVKEFYTYGIYTNGTNNALIEKNDISRPTRSSVSSFYAVYVAGSTTNAKISKNKIHDPFAGALSATSGSFGVYLGGAATVGNENMVSNNLMYSWKSNGPLTAFYNSSGNYVKYYHNTIVYDDQSSTTTSSYSTTGLLVLSDVPGIEFKNNIVYITRADASLKRALNFPTSTSNIVSNNNVLYVGSTTGTVNSVGAYGGTEFVTLANWKTANSGAYDQNSKSINPQFANAAADDYKPTEPLINNIGANVGITTDIANVARIVAAPDPGAYEFGTSACTTPPTAGQASKSPSTPVCGGEPVILNLTGQDFNTGITYQWESAATLSGPYTAVSGLLLNPEFTVNAPGTSRYYRAAVTCNSITSYSDTIQIVIPALFNGTYTIDKNAPTGGNNFTSFADALNAMRCGINGKVVFNVNPGSGPYTEQLIVSQVVGMSSSNTVTFNGNGEALNFASSNTNERGVIKLNGADYVTIKNFVINSTGTSTSQYAYGIHLLNDADNNLIDSCTINLNLTSTSSNYGGIMVNSSASGTVTTLGDSKCDNNIISNNTINGGSFGIAIVANGKTNQVTNNKVINNNVKDFYTQGIYLSGGVNTLIEGNEISRTARVSSITTCYSINLVDTSIGTKISKNRIHDPFAAATTSTSAAYGIRLNDASSEVGNETIISNNLIYNFANAGIQYGILINIGNNVKMYHNTISLDDQGATCTTCGTRSIYIQDANTTGLDISNNIFTISRGGTGDKQMLFFTPTSVSGFNINYNVYYYAAGIAGVNEIAKVGTTSYVTLADWKALNKDLNGLNVDPAYAGVGSGNFTPTQNSINNNGTPVGITTDITNAIRSTIAPDPGAYEFGTPLPVLILSFRGERTGDANRLLWSTSSESNNRGFELERSADGRNFTSLTFVATKATDGNSTSRLDYTYNDAKPLGGNNYYRLKQMDKDGKYSYSDIILLKSKVSEIQISSVYPNPTKDKLNVVITSPSVDKLTIIITDLSGKVIMQQSTSVAIGDNQQELNVSSLAAGTYVIKAICANGCETTVHRFVKQ